MATSALSAGSLIVVTVSALAACGARGSSHADASAADAVVVPDAPDPPDAAPDAPPRFAGAIYAHSNVELYSVDPYTLQVSLIAPFEWPSGSEQEFMTDIAVDKNAAITGISFGAVYSVDRVTAKCKYLSTLTREFNGLSYVPASEFGDTGDDVLVGTTLDGSIWKINPDNGSSEQIGSYGNGWISSGDLVSIEGFGTVATVNLNNEEAIDYLARIDFSDGGAATPIGSTGVYDLWGVGFWGGKVYGFAATNELYELNLATGNASLIVDGPVNWWGAGVTTKAPITL